MPISIILAADTKSLFEPMADRIEHKLGVSNTNIASVQYRSHALKLVPENEPCIIIVDTFLLPGGSHGKKSYNAIYLAQEAKNKNPQVFVILYSLELNYINDFINKNPNPFDLILNSGYKDSYDSLFLELEKQIARFSKILN